MALVYSPLLLVTAYIETKQAHRVKHNRRHGEQDEDTVEEWEQMLGAMDMEADGWAKKVELTRPNVETDAAVLEIRELKGQVKELRGLVEGIRGSG